VGFDFFYIICIFVHGVHGMFFDENFGFSYCKTAEFWSLFAGALGKMSSIALLLRGLGC
jgi:hypothetical protein